ncbi:MAG TPA: hypothetical protein VHO70_17285, partial [Chitinispirillaceae bacterium]|nr:hypothetical protein [Chitinispirillaceae bacterium]
QHFGIKYYLIFGWKVFCGVQGCGVLYILYIIITGASLLDVPVILFNHITILKFKRLDTVNAVSVIVFFFQRKDFFIALTPENEANIEKKMASLTALLRTSLNKDEFISDHSFYLANMEGDCANLHAAGLPLDKITPSTVRTAS